MISDIFEAKLLNIRDFLSLSRFATAPSAERAKTCESEQKTKISDIEKSTLQSIRDFSLF